jgi:cytoskeletal protein RodZ
MPESIGQQLQQARQARSLTLEQAAQAIHVRPYYLQALEADDFASLPSRVQARGFLRLYAEYLGLDSAALLAAMEGNPSDIPAPATPAAKEQPPEARPAPGVEVFQEIGQKLRQRRELLGLSLRDVERHTHLRINNLQALEAGNLEQLLSPVQARGMLGAYAEFLGLDSEALLLQFAEGLQARLRQRAAERPARRSRPISHALRLPTSVRWFFSIEFIVTVALSLGLMGFFLWAAIRIFAMQGAQVASPTAPPIAAVLLASESETPTPSPSPVLSTPTPSTPLAFLPQATESTAQVTPPSAGAEAGVRVYVTVRQRAWMRVIVDGQVAFEGRVIPGSAYQFVGEQQVEILSGNAAALQIFYNQQDYGPLGLFGQVVHQIFTRQGVLTPTPTVTLTPTRTPRPTNTLRPTATP